MFFRNSIGSKHLYISRFGCKQGAEKLIITHVSYRLKTENLGGNIQTEEFAEKNRTPLDNVC